MRDLLTDLALAPTGFACKVRARAQAARAPLPHEKSFGGLKRNETFRLVAICARTFCEQ